MEDSIGRLIASQALLGQMLMALSQALNLSKPANIEMVLFPSSHGLDHNHRSFREYEPEI